MSSTLGRWLALATHHTDFFGLMRLLILIAALTVFLLPLELSHHDRIVLLGWGRTWTLPSLGAPVTALLLWIWSQGLGLSPVLSLGGAGMWPEVLWVLLWGMSTGALWLCLLLPMCLYIPREVIEDKSTQRGLWLLMGAGSIGLVVIADGAVLWPLIDGSALLLGLAARKS